MDKIILLDGGLDYESLTTRFSDKGNLAMETKIKDEILAEIIRATTLKHNRWSSIPNKKSMFRSSGGFTLIGFNNRITLQDGGEAHLFLDEFDIKDIFNRKLTTIRQAKKADIENVLTNEPITTMSRADSQFMLAVKSENIEEFFSPELLKEKKGDLRVFYQNYENDRQVLTGLTWLKKRTTDYYQLNPDQLLRTPQIEVEKIDFLRIYDKLIEVIEKNPPFSEKRTMFIEKYKEYFTKGYRIFRVEIEERENRLSRHLEDFLNEKEATFTKISNERMKMFQARNPFGFWKGLVKSGLLKP